jgi:hypothetical protein
MIKNTPITSDLNANQHHETEVSKQVTSISGEFIGTVKLSPKDIKLLNRYLTKPQGERNLVHGPLIYKILKALEKPTELTDLKLRSEVG